MSDAPVVIIHNPIAGSGKASRLALELKSSLESMEIPARLEPTRKAGDGTRIATEWEGRCRTLFVVGGDGTIREVIQGLRRFQTPLATLPAGTSNVLAMELNLPRDPERAALLAREGTLTHLDVMELHRKGADPLRSLLFAGAGFDAEVVHRVARRRKKALEAGGKGNITKLSYVIPAFQAWLRIPEPSLQVVLDGSPLEGGPWGWVLVTNIASFGGLFHLGPGIRPGDGVLDVLALPAATPLQILRYGLAGFFRVLPRVKGLVRAKARHEIRIQGRGGIPVQVDGDEGGFTPLTVKRLKERVPFLVPAGKKRESRKEAPP